MRRKIKNRIQRDWLIAFTLTVTFLMLNLFGEIDWKWYWIVSPIWILLSIYLVVSFFAITIYNLTKK